MKRTILTTALDAALTEVGYAPVIADVGGGVCVESFPTAVIDSVALKKVEGRTEGMLYYAVRLRLLLCPDDTEPQDQTAAQLDTDAFAIAQKLREEQLVTDVTEVSVQRVDKPCTDYGDRAASVSMNVLINF